VSEEEAFVQAVIINSENPQIFRFLRDAIKNSSIKRERIQYYAKKYDIEALLLCKLLLSAKCYIKSRTRFKEVRR